MRRLALLVCGLAIVFPAAAQAFPSPVAWCGTGELGTKRDPALQLTSTHQIRVIYAVPADGADNFAAYASGIATDVAAIDGWWRGQDPTRAPRFDLVGFPGCGSAIGDLDLGFVRLPQSESAYRQGDSLGPLSADLASMVGDDEKLLVYYDGAAGDDRVCGISNVNPTVGGRFGLSIVFLKSSCDISPPGNAASAAVAAHELIHNLGAVPEGAPHECTGPDQGGHVCDSSTDLLWPFYSPGLAIDTEQLDFGRDDYYGHGGSQWDVQDSMWLSHLPQSTVNVHVSGSGSVALQATGGSRVGCQTRCTGFIDSGIGLQAFASAGAGWTFAGWSGPCTGASTCVIPSTRVSVDLTATFIPSPHTVGVRITGRGRVTSKPAGIACSVRCSHGFAARTTVRLSAVPARGWRFAGWTGSCTGTYACVVRADRDRSVAARFVRH